LIKNASVHNGRPVTRRRFLAKHATRWLRVVWRNTTAAACHNHLAVLVCSCFQPCCFCLFNPLSLRITSFTSWHVKRIFCSSQGKPAFFLFYCFYNLCNLFLWLKSFLLSLVNFLFVPSYLLYVLKAMIKKNFVIQMIILTYFDFLNFIS
jgi:hypothetical protein